MQNLDYRAKKAQKLAEISKIENRIILNVKQFDVNTGIEAEIIKEVIDLKEFQKMELSILESLEDIREIIKDIKSL